MKRFGNSKFHKGSSSNSKTAVKHDNNKSGKSYDIKKCFFCKKTGHFKKECEGFKAWLEKKGTFLTKPVFNINSNDFVSNDSWWFDTGSPIHIVTKLQGLSRVTIPTKDETKVCTANGQRVAVKAIGTVKLVFPNNYVLELNNVYCIPEIKRNLISGSQFVSNNGFSFSSNNKIMYYYYYSKCFGNAYVVGDYWLVNCTNPTAESNNNTGIFGIQTHSGKKRKAKQDVSSFLWHKRLGHISKERIKELVKQEILPQLDFTDFDTCVDCLKGKMTNIRKFGSKRSENLLDLIHTDICGPFPIKTICCNYYFITFIDDFSRHCYLYLISENLKLWTLLSFIKLKLKGRLESL